jgi:hypothetical protein
MDETTTETTPPAAQVQPQPAGGKPGRKPPSPEQARVAAERKRLKRKLEKLLTEGDAAALAAAAAKLEGGEAEAPVATAPEAPAELAKAEPAAPAAKAPTPEEVAAMTELAAGIVGMVAEPLAGTDFDPMKPRPNPLGGEPVVMTKALTEALAPVLAKHLPNMVSTPEGNLALAVALWLAPPLTAMAKKKLLGEGAPANVDGAGLKAG